MSPSVFVTRATSVMARNVLPCQIPAIISTVVSMVVVDLATMAPSASVTMDLFCKVASARKPRPAGTRVRMSNAPAMVSAQSLMTIPLSAFAALAISPMAHSV